MTLEWSPWQSIEAGNSTSGPAVYKIRLASNGEPVAIPRFLRIDSVGTLSIGVSRNMDKRRKNFLRSLARGRGHSEANLLRLLQMHSHLNRLYPDGEIQFTYAKRAKREDAAKAEEVLLKEYVVRFGELPPLNSAIPNRYNWQSWEDAASRIHDAI